MNTSGIATIKCEIYVPHLPERGAAFLTARHLGNGKDWRMADSCKHTITLV